MFFNPIHLMFHTFVSGSIALNLKHLNGEQTRTSNTREIIEG
ncbi:hypothetical protein ACHAXS_001182 [Conticribra weissflogii]